MLVALFISRNIRNLLPIINVYISLVFKYKIKIIKKLIKEITKRQLKFLMNDKYGWQNTTLLPWKIFKGIIIYNFIFQ